MTATKRLADIGIALVHVIGGLLLLGYAQNYYFHLRKFCLKRDSGRNILLTATTGHHKNNAH